MRYLNNLMSGALLCVCVDGVAAVYPLPPENTHVIGNATTISAGATDTFSTIALKYKLGFNAIASANPTHNAWSAGVDTKIVLPTQYILPQAEHAGVIINLAELRLYYFPPDSKSVYVYPVGIGRSGWQTPLADTRVTRIEPNPAWHPPLSIIREYQKAGLDLPLRIPPGPDNPLGDRAIRLALAGYLIHGTNKPEGVGMRVSHGCIRLYPEHIRELASMLKPGTRVQIINQPIKWGLASSGIMLESYRTNYDGDASATVARPQLVKKNSALAEWLNRKRKNHKLFSGIPQRYSPIE